MKKILYGIILTFATIFKFRSVPLPKEAPCQYFPKLKLHKVLTPNNKYFIDTSHVGIDLFFSHCPVLIVNATCMTYSYRRKLIKCIQSYGSRVTRDVASSYYRQGEHDKLGILLYQIIRNFEVTKERLNVQ